MIKPFVVKDFVPDDTIKILNYWALQNLEFNSHLFSDANMGLKGTRLTTRYFKDCKSLVFPDAALNLRMSIAEHLNISNYKTPNYCHGIVCGIGFSDGDIFAHKDPVYHKGTYTLHCNVITQPAEEGGITVIEDVPYPTSPKDVLVYPVSNVKHSVTTIEGSTPRILWVFGYCIQNET